MTIDLKNTPVCSCGSCQQALDAALADFQRLYTGGCMTWFTGHVIALNAVLSALLAMEAEMLGPGVVALEQRIDQLGNAFADGVDDAVLEQIVAIIQAREAGARN